jgi:hypothetical protein
MQDTHAMVHRYLLTLLSGAGAQRTPNSNKRKEYTSRMGIKVNNKITTARNAPPQFP